MKGPSPGIAKLRCPPTGQGFRQSLPLLQHPSSYPQEPLWLSRGRNPSFLCCPASELKRLRSETRLRSTGPLLSQRRSGAVKSIYCCVFSCHTLFLSVPSIFLIGSSHEPLTVRSLVTFPAPAMAAAFSCIAVFSWSDLTGPLSVTLPSVTTTFTLWASVERVLSFTISRRICCVIFRSPFELFG